MCTVKYVYFQLSSNIAILTRIVRRSFKNIFFSYILLIKAMPATEDFTVTIEMKPFQLYFNMVLFVLRVVLTFEFVGEILWCDYSNETSSAVLSHGTICFVCSSNF